MAIKDFSPSIKIFSVSKKKIFTKNERKNIWTLYSLFVINFNRITTKLIGRVNSILYQKTTSSLNY